MRELEAAEAEEARYQKMLDKAKAEVASAIGPKLDAYTQQIAMLEQKPGMFHAAHGEIIMRGEPGEPPHSRGERALGDIKPLAQRRYGERQRGRVIEQRLEAQRVGLFGHKTGLDVDAAGLAQLAIAGEQAGRQAAQRVQIRCLC